MELRALVVVLAACSGSKAKLEDAKPIVHPGDAAVARADAPPAGPYRVDAKGARGDASVRVEWHDVSLEARAPGPCGPTVAPTTMWGIPDTVVTIAADHGVAVPARAPRVVLDRCLRPAVQVATGSLTVASGLVQPAKLTIAHDAGPPVSVELPIAGHEVEVALEPGSYTLAADGTRAWVVAAATPYTAVTDGSGVAVLRDVPTGTYPVTAWSPASGRSAKGEVTVAAGQLAEVTLQLQP